MTHSSAVNERARSSRPVLFTWMMLSTLVAQTIPSSNTLAATVAAPMAYADQPVTIGHTAPELALPDAAGRIVTLAAYRGRPVILNFWATWCVPCRHEMPLLQQAHEAHQNRDLAILGINQDELDRSQAVRVYWGEAGLTFPTLLDPEGRAARRYQVVILPSTIFVNAESKVTAIHRGPLHAKQFQQYLDRLMGP